MAQLLILSPFAAFTALMLVAPAILALAVSAACAVAVICIDLWHGRSFKFFQVGAALTFAVVAGYVALIDPAFDEHAVRGAVDAGLLAVILVLLAVGLPFTIQYAREQVDAVTAARVEFRRANYLLTGVWLAAMLTMLVADLCAMYATWIPVWAVLAAAFAARNGAMIFTQWYAKQRRNAALKQDTALTNMGSAR